MALSAWEGVQAATASLYRSFLDANDDQFDLKVQKFGEDTRVIPRSKALREVAQCFLARVSLPTETARDIFEAVREALAAYEGFAQRRNDVAHGYVTESMSPDYGDEDQKLVTVFSLLPSHARTDKWFMAEPEFNYIASEIEEFAREFRRLDDRFEMLASRIEGFNKGRSQKPVL